MIYWFTGQPGHGKTLNAIEKLLEFKAKGRIVYACNVREFDYDKTGVLRMTPEDFRNWTTFLPDGAVALVDEAYEHGMLPKRPPGSAVPHHVEQLAKHRHRGLDFIFVSQSPDKQCDQFVQDLIEEHVHVRRMFGSKTVQLRIFDKYNANAEKATPISTKLIPLLRGKKAVGTYKSTEMDTTQKRIPWYIKAFVVGAPLALVFFWYVFGSLGQRVAGKHEPESIAQVSPQQPPRVSADGASATAAETRGATLEEYVAMFTPRIASQPWSAPIYDRKLSVSADPPRLFCMSSGPGETVDGEWRDNSSCTCVTEQGTRYQLEHTTCAQVSRLGQYEPFYDEPERPMTAQAITEFHTDNLRRIAEGNPNGEVGTAPQPMVDPTFGTITRATP